MLDTFIRILWRSFASFFVHHHLTPFCDGGGSWWTDARREMVDAIGDVRGKRVLDYACGFGMLGVYLSSSGADVCGFESILVRC